MHAETDRIVDWLVSGLEPQASVFHVGQYCGSDWRASTAGRARASFHLVLRGHCWLHRPGAEPLQLGPREAVFLLRDLPHSLTAERDPGPACGPRPMLPARPAMDGGTTLACGFFDFRELPGDMLVASFPDCLLLRAGNPALAAVAPLFDLLLAEAERDAAASPLMERLTELLFFYLVRELAHHRDVEAGLWAVWRKPQFAPLVERLLREPGRDWSVEDMARIANMSRASFFKHFVDACGQPPAQFLLGLRMRIAARRLRSGDSVLRAAEHVGYQSQAAFTRAFKKVIGEQPGAYQRARRDLH
ncbi:AraC family transcriptional regulator [Pseudothauera rhizosphaerae]|uniref:AraC family transcriptional regulator n=1 Tax=Pseudothauera rhizosphaerae TaxID=2565932 RepID=A0A4S4B0L9_9RHOO|nr:AraC family transcriptional regulator [Pseudothauera rhizosphaerae]THF65184.1 AraC family transcriptional regulator [Pseudothauera rhizosphaerae]